MSKTTIDVGPDHHLTAEIVNFVAKNTNVRVRISPLAKRRILRSRRTVELMAKQKKVVYGVTTGFGNFKNKIISTDDLESLQRNLIRSLSVGVGELLSKEQVRAAMLARLNSLVQGYSGVRLEFLELLCE